MHPTAMSNAKAFFSTYKDSIEKINHAANVVEIGSQDVNGSLRQICPIQFHYTGVDFVEGKGVDVILEDPYSLPFESESIDIIISSSCFEHSEMFWVLFLEILRVLKPGGLFYLNVPSNGEFHRWPVDCWRFYPDSGNALVTWAKRNKIPAVLLESYTSTQIGDQWNDFVGIFLKDEKYQHLFPKRITDSKTDFYNGLQHGSNEFLNYSQTPEDKKKMTVINQIINNTLKVL